MGIQGLNYILMALGTKLLHLRKGLSQEVAAKSGTKRLYTFRQHPILPICALKHAYLWQKEYTSARAGPGSWRRKPRPPGPG